MTLEISDQLTVNGGVTPITPYIFIEDAPTASEDFWVMMTDPGTFPANFSGSFGKALVAATASTVLTIKKLSAGVTTTIGTATWGIAGTTPTLATTGGLAQSFLAGDMVGYVFPASPDATLADIAISLRAQRT
jgi:FlaG/FlaF family flagellin (archaellin)